MRDDYISGKDIAICIVVVVAIVYFITTIMQWLFYSNYDACTLAQSAYDCVYAHPPRYTIEGILKLQWGWIMEHRLV